MLTANNLTCVRGDRVLFRNTQLQLNNGGLLYVLGENGSGKSSLLKVISGLLYSQEGEVLWNGKSIRRDKEEYQSNLVYIGHQNGLKDDLTALENLMFIARLANKDIKDGDALGALDAIGIKRCANLPVRVLSQGQKRRVALARLWITNSRLWVLDEPFAALDSFSIDSMASRIGEHLIGGGMAVITTHQHIELKSQSTQTVRLSS